MNSVSASESMKAKKESDWEEKWSCIWASLFTGRSGLDGLSHYSKGRGWGENNVFVSLRSGRFYRVVWAPHGPSGSEKTHNETQWWVWTWQQHWNGEGCSWNNWDVTILSFSESAIHSSCQVDQTVHCLREFAGCQLVLYSLWKLIKHVTKGRFIQVLSAAMVQNFIAYSETGQLPWKRPDRSQDTSLFWLSWVKNSAREVQRWKELQDSEQANQKSGENCDQMCFWKTTAFI